MKLHTLFSAVLIALVAPAAHAQSFAGLNATGLLVPGSCTIALSNNGIVALGAIDETMLDPQADTPVSPQSVSVNIACSGPTKVAAMVTENKVGTASRAADNLFGLGQTSGGAKIGYYEAVATSPVADSVPSTIITAPATVGGLWATPTGDAFLEHGAGRRFVAMGSAASGPLSLTTASMAIQVRPFIAPASQLMLPAAETIDGSMTLDLVYL